MLCAGTRKPRQRQLPPLVLTLNFFSNTFIAGHKHSTRDLRGNRLISINPIVTEQYRKELP